MNAGISSVTRHNKVSRPLIRFARRHGMKCAAILVLVVSPTGQQRTSYASGGWWALQSGQGCARKCYQYGEELAEAECGFQGNRSGQLDFEAWGRSSFGRLTTWVEARTRSFSDSWGQPQVCANTDVHYEDYYVVLGGVGSGSALFTYDLLVQIDEGENSASVYADVLIDGVIATRTLKTTASFQVRRQITFGQSFLVSADVRGRLTLKPQAAPWTDRAWGRFELVLRQVEAFDSQGNPVPSVVAVSSGADLTAPASANSRLGSGVNAEALFQDTPATLGSSWEAHVDLEGTGVGTWLVAGLGGPTSGVFLPSGRELLCRGPFRTVGTDPSGEYSVAVPLDPSLIGGARTFQAAVLTPTEVRLTNALDITVGTY